jgi:hypothetical protein
MVEVTFDRNFVRLVLSPQKLKGTNIRLDLELLAVALTRRLSNPFLKIVLHM